MLISSGRSFAWSLLTVVAVSTSAVACSASPDKDPAPTATTDDQIRQLRPDEYVGFLQYGDQITATYESPPMYRAYRFRANAFDELHITLTAKTAGAKVWATLLDEKGNDLTPTTMDGEVKQEILYIMPNRFGELTLAFREAAGKPADVGIELTTSGIREPATQFVAAAGSYAAPAPFASMTVDIQMRCLDRQHFIGGAPVETEQTGLLSLDFSGGKPKVVGSDGALGAPANLPELGIDRAALSVESEHQNAIVLRGATGSRAYKHLLHLTNTGPSEIRVEYALESIAGNTGTTASTLSCVGMLTNH